MVHLVFLAISYPTYLFPASSVWGSILKVFYKRGCRSARDAIRPENSDGRTFPSSPSHFRTSGSHITKDVYRAIATERYMDAHWKAALVMVVLFLNIFSLGMFCLGAWAIL
jgi:hypothetical protein